MKILITHTDFRLYWIPRLAALERHLRARGDDLIVVEMAAEGALYGFARKHDILSAPGKWMQLFEDERLPDLAPARVANALWQTLEIVNPDVVIAGAIAFTPGATAVRWCRTRGRPLAIMDNARLQDVPRPILVNWVKKRIYRNVDAVLTSAPSHASSYLAWGLPAERVFFGVNAVDSNWFWKHANESREKEKSVRQEYGLPKRYFLGIGRQVRKKNWRTLIEAYREYRRSSGLPWDLVLVGEGPDRGNLEAQVAESKIPGVYFFPFCSQEEACAYYAMASCLVLPSFYGETWGTVVNEAMSCGLPALVSYQCGCAETLVQDGRNGWKFSPSNPAELAQRLLQMAGLDDADLKAMGCESRSIVAEWDLNRFVEGATAAIEACKGVSRGFCSILDRAILAGWKGRYRPT